MPQFQDSHNGHLWRKYWHVRMKKMSGFFIATVHEPVIVTLQGPVMKKMRGSVITTVAGPSIQTMPGTLI